MPMDLRAPSFPDVELAEHGEDISAVGILPIVKFLGKTFNLLDVSGISDTRYIEGPRSNLIHRVEFDVHFKDGTYFTLDEKGQKVPIMSFSVSDRENLPQYAEELLELLRYHWATCLYYKNFGS